MQTTEKLSKEVCLRRSRCCNGYRACHWSQGSGSNPAEGDGFLRAIKIRSQTSFGREVKPSAPCRRILRHVKYPLRYDSDTDWQNSGAISRQISPRFVSTCLCCNHSRELWWMNREWLELRWVVQKIRNCRSCMGRFVRYHPITVTSMFPGRDFNPGPSKREQWC
jgi:hypothetical protein